MKYVNKYMYMEGVQQCTAVYGTEGVTRLSTHRGNAATFEGRHPPKQKIRHRTAAHRRGLLRSRLLQSTAAASHVARPRGGGGGGGGEKKCKTGIKSIADLLDEPRATRARDKKLDQRRKKKTK